MGVVLIEQLVCSDCCTILQIAHLCRRRVRGVVSKSRAVWREIKKDERRASASPRRKGLKWLSSSPSSEGAISVVSSVEQAQGERTRSDLGLR